MGHLQLHSVWQMEGKQTSCPCPCIPGTATRPALAGWTEGLESQVSSGHHGAPGGAWEGRGWNKEPGPHLPPLRPGPEPQSAA